MSVRAWQVVRHGEPALALELARRDLPAPGAGELRLRVRAASLGLPDVFLCRGTYAWSPPIPFVPGQELAGVVTGVGPGVERFRVGQRVMAVSNFIAGHGGFAEETLSGQDSVFRVPEGMSDAAAACFQIPWHTAHLALVRRGQLRSGETLVVLGAAGGTGLAAVRLGQVLGARVIAVAGGPEKLEVCRQEGAQVLIDHRCEDVVQRIRAETGGRGADLVFDPVGGAGFRPILDAVASEGRVLLIGFAAGSFADAPSAHVLRHNYSVVGVYVGAYDRAAREVLHEELLSLFARGLIAPRIDREVPFEELPRAMADLAARRVTGKVVVRLGSGPA